MQRFYFKILTPQGQTTTGYLDSSCIEEAFRQLDQRDHHLLQLRPAHSLTAFWTRRVRKQTLKPQELAIFVHQFSHLVQAGIPIANSLRIIAGQKFSPPLKHALTQACWLLEHGKTLFQAFEAHTELFGGAFLHALKVAEQSNALPDTLSTLATAYQRKARLTQKVQKALAYPLLLLGLTLGLACFLVLYLVPKLETFLLSFGQDLPFATRLLLQTYTFISHHGIWVAPLAGAGILSLILVYGLSRSLRYHVDAVWLKLPLLGAIARTQNLSRFMGHLLILMDKGRSMVHAIQEAANALSNTYMSHALSRVSTQVAQGHAFSKALEDVSAMPAMARSLIQIGEHTGQLDRNILLITELLEDELDTLLDRPLRLLEPLLMGIIGLSFLWIIYAIFMPLYEQMSLVS